MKYPLVILVLLLLAGLDVVFRHYLVLLNARPCMNHTAKPFNHSPVPPINHSNYHNHHHSTYHLPLERLLAGCGEICEIDKAGTPSLFFNYIEKAVDCPGLMSNEAIDAPMQSKTPPAAIPDALLEHFTYKGKVELGFYPNGPLNSRYLAGSAMQSRWTKEDVESMQQKCADGVLHGTYGVEETNTAKQGLQRLDLTGKHVLVIGSELPWIEACILNLGAKHVSTIEYGAIESSHPQISTYTPEQVRANVSTFIERFDAAVSMSSVEHSGLGRYGDSMNPWGDRQAIARAWCMVKPGGGLLLAVPSPRDYIEYNAHRNYGPIQLPHLTANWKQVWQGPNRGAGWNTVTVFTK